jgi:type II secretory pathway pseudopilin PulG
MELMVVVMILVVLAGVAVPVYMHYSEEAKVKAAYASCDTIAKAAQAYQVENGQFPASLAVLTQQQPGGKIPLLEPRYLIDPWGKEFSYNPQGHLAAYGKPDVFTTDSGGRMIGNWQTIPGEG